MIDALLWVATVVAVVLMFCGGGFLCWMLCQFGEWVVWRLRCAVCSDGGNPADYPNPLIDSNGWQQGDYRMCPKHLGRRQKIRYLEERSWF